MSLNCQQLHYTDRGGCYLPWLLIRVHCFIFTQYTIKFLTPLPFVDFQNIRLFPGQFDTYKMFFSFTNTPQKRLRRKQKSKTTTTTRKDPIQQALVRSLCCLGWFLPFDLMIVLAFFFQVMFRSGAKLEISRNVWGIDVLLFTPRAKSAANEAGLCLNPDQDLNMFGNKWRYGHWVPITVPI